MQATKPATTAELLLYPWIGAWLAGLSGRRWSADDDDYLTGLSLAAAVRAGEGVPRQLWTTRSGQRLELPAMGASTRLTSDTFDGPHWIPLRWITIGGSGASSTVALDDLDRHRSCFNLPMADRLDPEAWQQWRDQLTRAFDLIAACAPVRHRELQDGLRAIAPLAIDDESLGKSVTHRYAFGGFAAGLPVSPEELAATAIHEFQHSKLNALLDVVRLYDAERDETYFAPWRADPRPIGALLHGTYAFAAVADFWDSLRTIPSAERLATVRAAHFRTQAGRALRELEAAPGLTDTGRQFVALLSAGIADRSRPIPPGLERRVARQLANLERAWKLRNGQHAGGAPTTQRHMI